MFSYTAARILFVITLHVVRSAVIPTAITPRYLQLLADVSLDIALSGSIEHLQDTSQIKLNVSGATCKISSKNSIGDIGAFIR